MDGLPWYSSLRILWCRQEGVKIKIRLVLLCQVIHCAFFSLEIALWFCLVVLPWTFYCIYGRSAMIVIFKKYFDNKKIRKSRLGLFYFVKPFLPFLSLELPCIFALDILLYNGPFTMIIIFKIRLVLLCQVIHCAFFSLWIALWICLGLYLVQWTVYHDNYF